MSNLSFVRHKGDGTTTQFPLSVAGENIGYFRTTDIHTYVDNVEVANTINVASPHLVIITPAPKLGADVLIRRKMPFDKPYANFERGNNFGHRQINNSFEQQLYLTQEIIDGFLPAGYYLKQDLNMGGHRVTNAGKELNNHDLVIKETTDDLDNRLKSLENSVNTDSRFISWNYVATGGEDTVNPPYNFTSARVYLNGVRQTFDKAYVLVGTTIMFAEPLEAGDEVDVELGTEPKDFVQSDLSNHVASSRATGANRLLTDWVSSTEVITDTGSNNNIEVNVQVEDATKVSVLVNQNSMLGMTFNNKELKVIDTYATELSQWTIAAHVATKNKPKVKVYRPILDGLLSADVVYDFVYHKDGDFFEALVDKVYKHVIVPVGTGHVFEELHDAVNFAGQFAPALQMDVQYLKYNAANGYYPQKSLITVVIEYGTHVMRKQVRIGESDMNHVEILGRGYLEGAATPTRSIVRFEGTLQRDDLGFLNLWKMRFGEINGFTIDMRCDFAYNLQSVVRYQRTEARFKNMIVDISNATFSISSGTIDAIVCDREWEGFGNTLIGTASANPRTRALNISARSFGGFKIKGHWHTAMRIEGHSNVSSIDTHEATLAYLLTPGTRGCFFDTTGSGCNLTAAELAPNTGAIGWSMFLRGTNTIDSKWSEYVDIEVHFRGGVYYDSQKFRANSVRSAGTVFVDTHDTEYGHCVNTTQSGGGITLRGRNVVQLSTEESGSLVQFRDTGAVKTLEPLGGSEVIHIGTNQGRYNTVFSRRVDTKEIQLASPNGTHYVVTVDDSGNVQTRRV